MKPPTLTAEQVRIRERVMDQIGQHGVPASVVLVAERADGARARDVAAVADDLCPGAGRDYR